MRLVRCVLMLVITFAPGLAILGASGCVAARISGPTLLAGPPLPRPPAEDVEPPDDPCSDPDALDGLDDPCWVDVPDEEVRRALAGHGQAQP